MGVIINNPVAAALSPQIPPYTESHQLRSGSECRLRLSVPWGSKKETDFLGDTTGDANSVKRTAPAQHPTKPWLRCTSAELVDGKGAWRIGSGGLIEYYDSGVVGAVLVAGGGGAGGGETGRAIWELTFSFLPYDLEADSFNLRWVIRQSRDAIESMRLPGNTFKFLATGRQIPEEIAILRSTRELTYTWVSVPDVTVTALEFNVWGQVEGRMNSVNFDGAKPFSMLCLAPQKSDPYNSPGGTRCRDVTYHMIYRADSTWRDVYDKNAKALATVVQTNDNTKFIYGVADFNTLFV